MSDSIVLKMDTPVPSSLLDTGAQGVIGRPLDRIDGPLKVAGRATYAAEYALPDLAYGFLVQAKVGCGRITDIDTAEALAMPGVLDVVVDLETFIRNPQQGGSKKAPTQGVEEVAYFGEIIAIVVAEQFEQARDAAARVRVSYELKDGLFDFEGRLDDSRKPKGGSTEPHVATGDVDAALAEAPVTFDGVWTTPSQNSAAMEPHASTAVWEDDALTIYGSYQMPASDKQQLAKTLGLKPDKVRILSAYVGGGFGSKLGISAEAVAAAIAARKLGRPVKAVMSRQQVFDATVRRSNTHQRIRLGAGRDGRITAIAHETLCSNIDGEQYFEPAGVSTHFLYAGENRLITHDLVSMNWLLSGSMRAPGEAAGMLALEGAMDELAERLGMDPVELRKINDPEVDPLKGVPFSTRQLTRCLDEGAAAFGWSDRSPTPAARREGEWLIGHGMAASARSNQLQESQARVSIGSDGRAVVETDMTDIGTGTYTILAQIAGELLGLRPESIDVRLGDTNAPPGAGSGGSWGASSSGSSVYLACEALRAKIAEAMGCTVEELTLKDGRAIAQNRTALLTELVGDGLSAEGTIKPGKLEDERRQASYGAHFCEVRVNAVTGEVRVKRFVSTFAAGRILNEKTARSQCIGGIVFGIGAALTEELVHDPRSGRVVNHDLAEYHVPVNADVPHIEVHFLPERDQFANPLQSKGLGELGISGAGAAIANAIYNATGVRVRDFPLTLDKLLAGLPAV
jgi:xanthine dehydrogenase YagR molybdenum-binding subunit